MAFAAKFSGKQRSELQNPSPHRFIGDIQSAFSEQILDITETEGEANIKPDSVPNDRGRELVARKRDCHAPSYRPNRNALPFP
jgi:hypothetical protein